MRLRAERALRAASIVLVAFALWRLLGTAAPAGTVRVRSSSLSHGLASLDAGREAAVHVDIDAMPSPADRDALAAMAHAGTRVTWSAGVLPPLAAVAVRAREPGGPVRVSVASTVNVALSDGLAALDSLNAADAVRGALIAVGAPSGALSAVSGAARAPVGIPAAAALRPVLLVGRAGWEAKFAAAALEEQGWSVVERLFVAPTADVTQGAIGAIDTSHFSAIIAVDTALGTVGPSIVRFVREGGGLLLLADAADAPAVRGIAPAHAGVRQVAGTHAFDSADPIAAMPIYPLESPRGDVVRLTTRGAALTSAARREGAGRVVQAGFDETWRWRMQGGSGAVAAHRAWWSRMIASVAATPLPAAGDVQSAEGAPVARWIAALGPAVTEAPSASAPRRLPVWLLPALLICLLAEWGSRRSRGAQ
jgi:hypothetical protein